MKKMFRTLTVTFGAAVVALAFGTAAHAGGAYFGLDVHLPLPPLPPIPVPFGFVDVNGPAHVHGPAVCGPACGDVTIYAPTYRPVYRGYRYDRYDRREWRHDWRDRREARRDWRHERRDWRHGHDHDGWGR